MPVKIEYLFDKWQCVNLQTLSYISGFLPTFVTLVLAVQSGFVANVRHTMYTGEGSLPINYFVLSSGLP